MNRLTASHLIVCLLAAWASIAPARADEPAANPEQLKAEGQQRLERETSSMPSIGPREVRDVIRFSIDNGDLAVHTNIEDTQGKSRVQLKDLSGISTVMVQGRQDDPAGGDGGSGVRLFEFTHNSFNTPGALKVQTHVFATVGYGLQVARTIERLGEDALIQFIQMRRLSGIEQLVEEESVTLYVQVMNNLTERTTVDLKLSAPNIVELRWLYPRETAEYLQPIFDDLGHATVFAVDPRLAWLVFSDVYKPDPALKEKVDGLVARLDSDNFDQREDALALLQTVGQDAALYLMNVDRSEFSAEQNSLIDTFLAEYQPVTPQRAQALKSNVGFLLDCLYSEEEPIRARALAALEEIGNQDLPFDPVATAPERLAAIAKVRETLLGTASTQPAPEPADAQQQQQQQQQGTDPAEPAPAVEQ